MATVAPLALQAKVRKAPLPERPVLLRFLVIRVLAAGVAELGELKTARGGLLVLGGGVVPVLADRALQGDDLAHDVLLSLANRLGWLAACFGSRLTRRNAG